MRWGNVEALLAGTYVMDGEMNCHFTVRLINSQIHP